MDFIKRIEGLDGSIAYVYGYNDKILRIGADGKIEYNDRLGDYEEIKSISFGDGLKLALKNLAKYGSIPNSLYLADYYESSESGTQEKRYYFNYKIKDLNVFSKNMINGYAVEIVLKGNKITSLNRNIKQYTKTITMSEVWPNGPLYPDAVIDKNFKTISSNYDIDFKIFDKEAGENWSMNTYISDIIRNIRNIEIAYLSNDDNEDNLIPTWHFSIGSTYYYFDLYSGKLLYGYKSLTEDNFLNDNGEDSKEKENSKK